MKNLKRYLGFVILCALLITSCSKESNTDEPIDPNATATFSFATMLNDMMDNKAALKQEMEGLPECSDAAPDHVAIVLSGPETVGSMSDPYEIDVNPTPGNYDDDPELEYFTEYDAGLELPPGLYTLEYFVVYDGVGNIIWVAPTNSGDFAAFVDDPLPMNIDLDAGVKKYVDVEVLCFDDREVNKYGYLFFDIETIELFEYCFFINYCDENGRHFPASYTVDFWLGTDDTGMPLYNDVANHVDRYEESDEPYANPLCLFLPNLEEFDEDEVYLYYEITLQDWTDVYGDVDQSVISGTLSRADIMANFDGENNVDYEHLRFGCGEDPGNGNGEEPDTDEDGIPNDQDQCQGFDDKVDTDGDGVADGCDECPEEDGTYETNGCADIGEPPVDTDEDGVPDTSDNCPETANENQEDSDGDGLGDVCDDCPNEAGPEANNGCPEEPTDTDDDGVPDTSDVCPGFDDNIDADSDGIPDGCDDCPNEAGPEANNGCPEEPTDTDGDGVPDTSDVCPGFDDNVDADSDGIPDGCDDCDNEAGPASNNGCPEDVELCTIADPTGTGCIVYTIGDTNSLVEITDNGPINLVLNGVTIGSFAVFIENGTPRAVSELTAEGDLLWTGYQIYLSSSSSSADIFASECGSVDNSGTLSVPFEVNNISYPIHVQLKANLCPASDGS